MVIFMGANNATCTAGAAHVAGLAEIFRPRDQWPISIVLPGSTLIRSW